MSRVMVAMAQASAGERLWKQRRRCSVTVGTGNMQQETGCADPQAGIEGWGASVSLIWRLGPDNRQSTAGLFDHATVNLLNS